MLTIKNHLLAIIDRDSPPFMDVFFSVRQMWIVTWTCGSLAVDIHSLRGADMTWSPKWARYLHLETQNHPEN